MLRPGVRRDRGKGGLKHTTPEFWKQRRLETLLFYLEHYVDRQKQKLLEMMKQTPTFAS